MTDEQKLLERLRLIESLHSGAATPGERDAAAAARERIQARLRAMQVTDPPIEYSFKLGNRWSYRLMSALLRRYGIKPYRYRGQRYTTLMARVPERFVSETLWPEFCEIDRTLTSYLDDVTRRVISEAITRDTSDVEERPGQSQLGAGSASAGSGAE